MRRSHAGRSGPHSAMPSRRLAASAPNQVWTWDITQLPTMVRGVFLCLYVILDLYSRVAVGWMVSRKQNAGLAKHLFRHTLARHGIEPNTLIVHQDRGAPMTAHCFADFLTELGVDASYSRPRVSNDNAFSESQFKTLKFNARYPGRFQDAADARAWLTQFFDEYHQRPHEGMALYPPNDLHLGRVEAIAAIRQDTLDRHFQQHPDSYPNGHPVAAKPPKLVTIKPPDGEPENATDVLNRPCAFRPTPVPTEQSLPAVINDKKHRRLSDGC